MDKSSRIYVAGIAGWWAAPSCAACGPKATSSCCCARAAELDLTDRAAVEDFFSRERPEYVFLAAAKVGGIGANSTYPADFIRENLQIQVNLIDAAYRHGARKLVFLGSSCIYPKFAPQPIKEDIC